MGPLFDKDFLNTVDLFHTPLPRLHRFSVRYQKPHAAHMQNTVDGRHRHFSHCSLATSILNRRVQIYIN